RRGRVVPDDRDVDAGYRQVDVELDARDGDERGCADPRIANLARDQLGQDVAQAMLDALLALTHDSTSSRQASGTQSSLPAALSPEPVRSSITASGDAGASKVIASLAIAVISAPPAAIATRTTSSISASAFWRSLLATATPSSERCQASLAAGEPTSLTNTPRRSRTRSLIRRITMRLSFSECAPVSVKLIRAIPTYTLHPTPPASGVPRTRSRSRVDTLDRGDADAMRRARFHPGVNRARNLGLQLRGFLDHFVGFDHVVLLDLVPAGDHHAALVALLDLADIVLEPAQAADLALVDLDGVPDDPQVRLAGDLALGDHAASDHADLGDRERLADRQLAHRDLAPDRSQQAG